MYDQIEGLVKPATQETLRRKRKKKSWESKVRKEPMTLLYLEKDHTIDLSLDFYLDVGYRACFDG
jgi:hypothetical protein